MIYKSRGRESLMEKYDLQKREKKSYDRIQTI